MPKRVQREQVARHHNFTSVPHPKGEEDAIETSLRSHYKRKRGNTTKETSPSPFSDNAINLPPSKKTRSKIAKNTEVDKIHENGGIGTDKVMRRSTLQSSKLQEKAHSSEILAEPISSTNNRDEQFTASNPASPRAVYPNTSPPSRTSSFTSRTPSNQFSSSPLIGNQSSQTRSRGSRTPHESQPTDKFYFEQNTSEKENRPVANTSKVSSPAPVKRTKPPPWRMIGKVPSNGNDLLPSKNVSDVLNSTTETSQLFDEGSTDSFNSSNISQTSLTSTGFDDLSFENDLSRQKKKRRTKFRPQVIKKKLYMHRKRDIRGRR